MDFEYFHSSLSPRKRDKIVYIGGLVFKPAFEGLFYFLKEIWPEIRKGCPGIRFYIIGKCPPVKLEKIKGQPGVTFLGYMEDVRTFMSTFTVAIVPYRIASGVRLKILEWMAMRLPVVSTSTGCEGIEAVDGEHLLIADNPKTFARKTVLLLKDENLRNQLAENAYHLVRSKYTWQNAGEKLERVYDRSIVSQRSAG